MKDNQSGNQHIFYLQVKVSRRVKHKLKSLADSTHRPVADIIRGALFFGIPVLENVLSIEEKLTGLIARLHDSGTQKIGRPSKEMFDKFL
jgi:hypothetical protein